MKQSKFLSRKFLLIEQVFITATVLLWFGKLDAGSFVALCSMTIGAYLAANAWQNKTESQPKEKS